MYEIMRSRSFFLNTLIVVIVVFGENSIAHFTCGRCNYHVCLTVINYLVFIICGSVGFCCCGDMVVHRVMQSLLPQGSNSCGIFLGIPSVHVLIRDC